MIDEVCVLHRAEGGNNCRERRPQLYQRAPVWVLADAPGVLGTRPVGDVIGQSPGTAPCPLTFTPRNRMKILVTKPYALLTKLAISALSSSG